MLFNFNCDDLNIHLDLSSVKGSTEVVREKPNIYLDTNRDTDIYTSVEVSGDSINIGPFAGTI